MKTFRRKVPIPRAVFEAALRDTDAEQFTIAEFCLLVTRGFLELLRKRSG
jgi:hypothetical protein